MSRRNFESLHAAEDHAALLTAARRVLQVHDMDLKGQLDYMSDALAALRDAAEVPDGVGPATGGFEAAISQLTPAYLNMRELAIELATLALHSRLGDRQVGHDEGRVIGRKFASALLDSRLTEKDRLASEGFVDAMFEVFRERQKG